ncbi:dual specificity protein phosphatase family protein [Candidatus Binatia bacterium]|jgi:protein-tyrosine phosphatase|nr:dual specificity protein phosphatase family protein [Candidatus Binatia bacterium]
MRPAGRPGVSHVIDDALLIGEYPTADDATWLRDEHGIATVVCLQDEFDLAAKNLVLERLVAAYVDAGLAFHHHPIADGDAALLAARLPAILAVIDAALVAGRRVYVHCNAGFNRAPTVAIAYLRAHRGLSDGEAWAHVKLRRACAPYRRALELHFGDAPRS